MVCHSLLGKVGDMHLYCLHDRNVVINNAWRPGIILGRIADEFYHGGLIHCQIGEQHLIALLDILVAAGLDYKAVEWHVCCDHAVIVPADNTVGKFTGKPVKLIYGAGIGALCAQGGSLALDRSAHVVKIYHIFKAQINYKETARIRL